MKQTFALALFLLAGVLLLPAQEAPTDTAGCKDSSLIARMPGSHISGCDHRASAQLQVPMGVAPEGEVIEKTVEGEYWSWDYATREGSSELQVYRNFEKALRQAGFEIDYTSTPGFITAHKGNTWYKLENTGARYYQYIVETKS